ncbi:MAG TPA: hypothetical protein VKM55_18025 [Candidatus Lokiarchaeia archaeon]|nr:hypothetical protein [Candidatus Lokiarchaeia archaeon]
MEEEILQRLEKKIDLLYKLVLNAKCSKVDHLSDLISIYDVQKDLEALKEAFLLTETRVGIEPPSNSEIESVQDEIHALQAKLDNGYYMKKEESMLKDQMLSLQQKISEMQRLKIGLPEIQKKEQLNYQERLYQEFLDKIGADQVKDKRFRRR